MKRRTSVGSLMPGADSTPVATSTPHGRTRSMASATLSGVSPPARSTRSPDGRALGERPVEHLPGAGARGVDHHDVGAEGGRPGEVAGRRRGTTLMTTGTRSRTQRVSASDSWPCSWAARRPAWLVSSTTRSRASSRKIPTVRISGGQPLDDVGGARHREEPRRRRHEVEADRVGAHGHREEGVLLGGDAADLDEHAVEATDAARGDRRPIAPGRRR